MNAIVNELFGSPIFGFVQQSSGLEEGFYENFRHSKSSGKLRSCYS